MVNTYVNVFIVCEKLFMARFLNPPPPALPGACFRCSAIAASMSESVVLGLHLFKASEGREYEYIKKKKNQRHSLRYMTHLLILKMSLWSYN